MTHNPSNKQSGPSNPLLQPLSRLSCLILPIILIIGVSPINSHALDVAVKTGITTYDEARPSEYSGNNCYDEELSYGAFIRVVKDNWILRFDIDRNDTGNTFLHPLGIAYEQINLRQKNYTLSLGSYLFRYLYILLGATYTDNSGNIEQYAPYPFSYKLHDSFGPSVTVGLEKSVGRCFFFTEYRHIWNEMEVRIDNSTITEDTGNSAVYFGMGVKW